VRTTLTLDEDVAKKLKAEARKTGRTFKEVVNESLRRGLASRSAPAHREPFQVESRPMGLRPGLSYDSVANLLEQLEGPDRR